MSIQLIALYHVFKVVAIVVFPQKTFPQSGSGWNFTTVPDTIPYRNQLKVYVKVGAHVFQR